MRGVKNKEFKFLISSLLFPIILLCINTRKSHKLINTLSICFIAFGCIPGGQLHLLRPILPYLDMSNAEMEYSHSLSCQNCSKSRYFCGRILARILRSWKVYAVFHVWGFCLQTWCNDVFKHTENMTSNRM